MNYDSERLANEIGKEFANRLIEQFDEPVGLAQFVGKEVVKQLIEQLNEPVELTPEQIDNKKLWEQAVPIVRKYSRGEEITEQEIATVKGAQENSHGMFAMMFPNHAEWIKSL